MSEPALDYLLKDQRYHRLKPMSRYLAIICWASRYMSPCGFAKMTRKWLTEFSGIERDLDVCIHNLQQERIVAWHEESGLMWARGRTAISIPVRQHVIDEFAANIHKATRGVDQRVGWVRRALQETIGVDERLGFAMSRHQWQFPLDFPQAPTVDLPTDHSPEVVLLSEVARQRAEKAAKLIGENGEAVDRAIAMWNEMAERAGLSPIMMMTDQRRATMALRLRDLRGLDKWAEVLAKVEASDFLCDRAGKSFRADFEWITNLANLTRVREGKYDTRREHSRAKDRVPTNGDRIRRGLADALERRRRMDARSTSAHGYG